MAKVKSATKKRPAVRSGTNGKTPAVTIDPSGVFHGHRGWRVELGEFPNEDEKTESGFRVLCPPNVQAKRRDAMAADLIKFLAAALAGGADGRWQVHAVKS